MEAPAFYCLRMKTETLRGMVSYCKRMPSEASVIAQALLHEAALLLGWRGGWLQCRPLQ
jgi:hypothetical protein